MPTMGMLPPRRQPPRPSLNNFVNGVLNRDDLSRLWDEIFPGFAGPSQSIEQAQTRLQQTAIGSRMLAHNRWAVQEAAFLAVQILDPNTVSHSVQRLIERPLSKATRWIVVFHDWRSSMVVLEPDLPADQPAQVVPPYYVHDILETDPALTLQRLQYLGADFVHDPVHIAELLLALRPAVIIAPAPRMIKTCVPVPSCRATSGNAPSSVGALVHAADGTRGVTVCYHGTGNVGTAVSIEGGSSIVNSSVALASEALDTCFVPTGDWHPEGLRASIGALRRRAPAKSEAHTFHRFGNHQPVETRIIGVDWGVPFASKGRQLCVQTTADTNYGDSGSALVNADEQLVGFAFQRTPFGDRQPVEFADWIWAESALSELNLTLA